MSSFITDQLDVLVFALILLLVLFAVHRIALRRAGFDAHGWWHRIGYVVIVALSWTLVSQSEQSQIGQLRASLLGPLPTYAAELQRMGHSLISTATDSNDAAYLRMIEAEKRWLRLNPDISDIFTFRRTHDGKAMLIVDAESELALTGESPPGRDTRAAIGERAQVNEALLQSAYAGQRGIDDKPFTDKWGTWVTAYTPIHNDSGQVEAVLGVHASYDAWQAAIHEARLSTLRKISLVLGFASVFAFAFGLRTLAKHHVREKLAARELEESKSRLESIVNSIDGVVWEWQQETESYVFVSQQAEDVTGITSEELIQNVMLWQDRVHQDDLPVVLQTRRDAMECPASYSVDYRFTTPDGKIRWLRERGIRVHHEEGEAHCLRGILVDITASKESASQLEGLNRQLVEASRIAGMAEVASGVLHNVGNVLNSVNVSSTVICDVVHESKVHSLTKVAQLVRSQEKQLDEFFRSDPRGKALPRFLEQIANELSTEHNVILKEMQDLVKNVTHIKQIVMMQQTFARTGGNLEPLPLKEILEDAVRINESALTRHEIQVVREYAEVPDVLVDRNKVLQIFVNLIRNAKHAMQDCEGLDRQLTLSVGEASPGHIVAGVRDNGTGMSADTIAHLFHYGFTTKKNGHGFGLHSGANAAREMGGSLTGRSKGPGHGSEFFLEVLTVEAAMAVKKASPESHTETLPTLPALPVGAKTTWSRPRTPHAPVVPPTPTLAAVS